MSNLKKHTDVVPSMEVFNKNYQNGMYIEPWVVYVGNDSTGYNVIYSNDEKKISNIPTPDVIDNIKTRLRDIEDEKVFCLEDEYDNLVKNGIGWITDISGERIEVTFDENKMYYIYENDEMPQSENIENT